jgi:peptide/nickel transport system permease protein
LIRYIVQRIGLAVVTLVLVSVLVFVLLRVIVPAFYGDAVDLALGEAGGSDPALTEQLKEEYGHRGNLVNSYLEWVGSTARGDFGKSLIDGRPVSAEIRSRIAVSFELGLVGLLSSLLFSVPMGIVAALAHDRWPDYLLRTFAILMGAIPSFWITIMIITLGSLWFHLAPPLRFAYLTDDPVAHVKIMLLPSLLIGLTPGAGLMRLVRTQMLEVMRQDYIRTARAKGLQNKIVVMRHALRNGLIPVVTLIGLRLPHLVAGTAIFEAIFSLPGMGQYLVSSVGKLDIPVLMSTNLMFAVLIVASNLVVDLSYPMLDPRITY